MKPSRFKKVLDEGKVPVGHMLVDFNVRGIAKMLEVAGVDFVVIDMEHSSFTSAEVADIIACFKATTISPFVRVPVLSYDFIARTLDAGALGIMVPNVKTGAQARAIVNAAKYSPMGNRGLTFADAHSDYKNVDPKEFMEYSNVNTTIICQIESEEALNNIDQIAKTQGVDVLWVGQYDLTLSMGIVGDFKNKKFYDALDLVIKTAKKYEKYSAIQSGNLDSIKEWFSLGFNIISYNEDLAVYVDTMTRMIAEVRNIIRT